MYKHKSNQEEELNQKAQTLHLPIIITKKIKAFVVVVACFKLKQPPRSRFHLTDHPPGFSSSSEKAVSSNNIAGIAAEETPLAVWFTKALWSMTLGCTMRAGSYASIQCRSKEYTELEKIYITMSVHIHGWR
jgi:hypothetical protein